MDTSTSGSSSTSQVSSTCTASSTRISKFKEQQAVKDLVEIKNDLERYLLETCEDIEKEEFDVLHCWKVHRSIKHCPNLQKMCWQFKCLRWLPKVLSIWGEEF
ncbi:Hypothetical predicted protein [Olea europaea subsp. europaea]|uniref:Uncharacterized protein n=1 Tax=Olea europaea subsp. europaea TaxID=158383 RepID=A0A8S0SMU6_OLEEU|nr:Hypothetical predicted protein [Olea europaea subsp. europaea]